MLSTEPLESAAASFVDLRSERHKEAPRARPTLLHRATEVSFVYLDMAFVCLPALRGMMLEQERRFTPLVAHAQVGGAAALLRPVRPCTAVPRLLRR